VRNSFPGVVADLGVRVFARKGELIAAVALLVHALARMHWVLDRITLLFRNLSVPLECTDVALCKA
jgi:hypothetical protein